MLLTVIVALKNGIARFLPLWGLGGLSMLFLTAFLAFWLQKEYQEQKTNLKKEVDVLFKNTIQALEDSLIQSKISLAQAGLSKRTPSMETQPKTTAAKPIYKPTQSAFAIRPRDISAIRFQPRSTMTISVKDSVNFKYISSDSVLDLVPQPDPLAEDGKPKSVKVVAIYANKASFDTLQNGVKSLSFTLKSERGLSDSLQKVVFGKLMRAASGMGTKPLLDSTFKNNPVKWRYAMQTTHRPTVRDCMIVVHKNDNSRIDFVGVQEDKTPQIILSFLGDSLRLQDIRRDYQFQIAKAKIELPFEIVRQKQSAKRLNGQAPKHSNLQTDFVSSTMPVGAYYAAVFPDYQGYLFKKIIPQSLFSLFLLGITGLAFASIYQNFQRQRRLIQLKNDFISNVTHELKTPIATVNVAIEALQNFGVAKNPAQTQEYLEISKNELNRLTLLVDKVLKMATFEEQGLALNKEPVHLPQLIQQVLRSMKLQFEKYGASLTDSALVLAEKRQDEALPWGEVLADRIHLTNVIYNLLDNALKYSHKAPEIAISLNQTDTEIGFSVTDKGIGIATEYQPKIFEKFFRVPTGDTHNVKGHGLGLSYVASVVQQHEGRVEVQSKEGSGSTFTVILPKNT